MSEQAPRHAGLYAQAVLGRSGLANMLAPWVRAFVWSTDHGAKMLAPRWFKLRRRAFRRGERDKRQYHRYFTNIGYTAGLERAWILTTARRTEESALGPNGDPGEARLVRFIGHGDWSKPYGWIWPALGRSQEIHSELRRITVPKMIPAPPVFPFVAVHIRMGDFHRGADEAALRAGIHNRRLPLEWYGAAIVEIRAQLDIPVPVRVFSDGFPEELSPVLSLPDTELMTNTSAITDLLDIAQSAALVGSGSTFSKFGSFLGQLPSLWFPGQRMGKSVMDRPGTIPEVVWEPGQDLPSDFVNAVLGGLSQKMTFGRATSD